MIKNGKKQRDSNQVTENTKQQEEGMKPNRIEIEPFHFKSCTELVMKQQVNEHAFGRIKGILDKETDEELLEKMSADETITIKAESEDGEEMVLFKGLIHKASLSMEDGTKVLEIEAVSHTSRMDMKRNTCIFQDTSRTYLEIARYIGGKYGARVIGTEGRTQEIGQMVVQYQETDWEFLKRMASQLNTVLVADSINGKISYSFGPVILKKRELLDYSKKMVRNMGEFYRQRNQGREACKESDTAVLIVTTREVLELCTPVQLGDLEYLVKGVTMRLEDGQMMNTCELVFTGGMKTVPIQNGRIRGASLEGTIEKVKRDKVQVHFPQDVDHSYVLFPYATAYSSPDGAGWYCMPEIGDAVRVYFPDKEESHGVAVNMIHLTCGMREEPEIKYIRSPYDKEIRFEPGTITLTNHKGMSVVLDDKRGISLKSGRDVVILSEGDIEMNSKKNIRITGDQGVIARQGDNRIEIEDGIRQIARTISQK